MNLNQSKDLSHWSVAEKRDERENSPFYAAILFFVWPLLAASLALSNYRSRWGKNILWAFVAFYGMSFAIGAESQNSDIVRYVEEVKYLHGMPMSVTTAWDYYSQSGEVDILRTFIAVSVSRFTGNQIVLTLVYGIIFGFFFSRNIWYVLDRLEGKIHPFIILLIVSLFLVIPIWSITTFRMWTAAHIFIYGVLPFLYEEKWRGVFIASLSILVHFSFIIPVSMLCVYILFGNRLLLYGIFFVATFFIAEINLEAFNNVVETYAPVSIQERTEGYRGENYVESYRDDDGSGKVWYAVWYTRGLNWVLTAFLIALVVQARTFFQIHKKWLNLLCFTLLFYGTANIFTSLPSGSRFVAIANVLSLVLMILYLQNREDLQSVMKYYVYAVPLLLLFIVVSLRMALYSLSATAIFGNPIISIFFSDDQLSLNDVLNMLI